MLKSFSLVALLAVVPFAAAATSTITSISPDQSSKIESDLSTYLTHLTAQPEFTSVALVLQTAVPFSVLQDLEADPQGYYESIITGTATPSWIAALPTDAQKYLESVGSAEIALATKDLGNAAPQPTGALKLAGAAVAGVVGIAAFL
ncbi:MAG: hypothetical protein M4579_005444 [Chaenotheca gracillima]|nr:MAG: hypothetical protein M4579_005444 [Chaenotheca gracillima]